MSLSSSSSSSSTKRVAEDDERRLRAFLSTLCDANAYLDVVSSMEWYESMVSKQD